MPAHCLSPPKAPFSLGDLARTERARGGWGGGRERFASLRPRVLAFTLSPASARYISVSPISQKPLQGRECYNTIQYYYSKRDKSSKSFIMECSSDRSTWNPTQEFNVKITFAYFHLQYIINQYNELVRSV